MNILSDKLPNVIRVNGIEISIHTDFRTWLKAGQIIRDSENRDTQEVIESLADLILVDFSDLYELHPNDFISAITAFYSGFPRMVGEGSKKETKKRKPDFDFEADAEFIYSSFALCYHIRLCEIDMHWWEFLILFDGLMFAENNAISLVVGTRQTDLKDVPKSDKKRIRKLKKEFELPKDKAEIAMQKALSNKLAMVKGDADHGE
jgi:hypothetical protein